MAKLLDFGLAKSMTDIDDVQLTQAGSITGSPLYMSPEQATGDLESDTRGDIYSLGAVAYYLLTCVPPFGGDQPLKVIIADATLDAVPPSEARPDVPADLEAVIVRRLAMRPIDAIRTPPTWAPRSPLVLRPASGAATTQLPGGADRDVAEPAEFEREAAGSEWGQTWRFRLGEAPLLDRNRRIAL